MPMHHASYNWAYVAEKEPALEGRVVSCPRGKGITGSSAINGMVYVRGHPRDFDSWEEMARGQSLGAPAALRPWDAAHVPALLSAMESVCAAGAARRRRRRACPAGAGATGRCTWRTARTRATGTPLYDAFVKAGGEAGYGALADYNGSRQEGLSPMPMTVFHSGAARGR